MWGIIKQKHWCLMISQSQILVHLALNSTARLPASSVMDSQTIRVAYAILGPYLPIHRQISAGWTVRVTFVCMGTSVYGSTAENASVAKIHSAFREQLVLISVLRGSNQ